MSPGHGGTGGLGLARGDTLGWVRIVPTIAAGSGSRCGFHASADHTHRLGGTCAMVLPGLSSASPVTPRPAAPTPYGRRCAPAESDKLRGRGGCTLDSRTALISSPSDHARAPPPVAGSPQDGERTHGDMSQQDVNNWHRKRRWIARACWDPKVAEVVSEFGVL